MSKETYAFPALLVDGKNTNKRKVLHVKKCCGTIHSKQKVLNRLSES